MSEAQKPQEPTPKEAAARHGFLSLLRWLERRATDKPRIGGNSRVRDEIVSLGQDPYLGFATSDLSEVDLSQNPPKVRPRFLGFFGPFGPLPLAFSTEADRWAKNGDWSFVRFVDIFATRFIQLFFRSWSDARAITQFDHPSGGEFPKYLRAFTGDASPAFDGTGTLNDTSRLRFTALLHGRVKSPVKLRQAVAMHFGLKVRVEEFVPSWLNFDEQDVSLMGQQSMTLGQDTKLGSRSPTLCEKVTLHLDCQSLEQYQSFLPGRRNQQELADLVLAYFGYFFSVDVALWLPQNAVAQAQIGRSAELGWMTAIQSLSVRRDDVTKVRVCKYNLKLE